MSIDLGDSMGVLTILFMVLFIGIWIWAWRKKHRKKFDRMAALPMEDDFDAPTDNRKKKDTEHD